MSKKFVLGLSVTLLISCFTSVFAYNSDELNKRLLNCQPSKDFDGGISTIYQISGLTGDTCIFKIQSKTGNTPDLICKVPKNRMREMISYNPMTVQGIKNQYCVISLKPSAKSKGIYY